MGWVIAAFFLGLILGYNSGWVRAHTTVAKECERLGSFYAGKKVFHCTKVETKE